MCRTKSPSLLQEWVVDVAVVLLALIANHEKMIQLAEDIGKLADEAINGGVRDLEARMLEEEKMLNEEMGLEYTEEEMKAIVAARLNNNHFSLKINEKVQKMKRLI